MGNYPSSYLKNICGSGFGRYVTALVVTINEGREIISAN